MTLRINCPYCTEGEQNKRLGRQVCLQCRVDAWCSAKEKWAADVEEREAVVGDLIYVDRRQQPYEYRCPECSATFSHEAILELIRR